MSGNALVATVLVTGGVVYMVIFIWVTVVRVREEYDKMWPPERAHHK